MDNILLIKYNITNPNEWLMDNNVMIGNSDYCFENQRFITCPTVKYHFMDGGFDNIIMEEEGIEIKYK